MRSLLQRLFGRPTVRRTAVRCYLRENGPIAYEFDLFGPTPRDRVDVMLESAVAWAWQSRSRDWTHLTRISLSAFLADLPSGVLLVGVAGELPTDVSSGDVKDWIHRFARLQPTPLEAVVSAAAAQQLLFVQQHASDAINGLLDAWGLDKRAAERRAYARLGSASLEARAAQLQ